MHFVTIAVFVVWFVGGIGFKLARIASEEKN